MTARLSRQEAVGLLLILAALLLIYLPGLGNSLVYDDTYLTAGLFDDYRGLALRTRVLSYGSFVWLQALLGDGWWKQRFVNLAIHAGVVLALWGFYREILARIASPAGDGGDAADAYVRSPALPFAIGFYALNPVAVYGVAYLIQRSILLATLFTVLALWCFARAIAYRRWWLYAAALACYVLAVTSKEYAVLAPLAAVPVYIVMARPSAARLAVLGGAGAVLIGVAGALLYQRYGYILGTPFDEYSRVYLAQLSTLSPEAGRHAYPLSIVNEAWLFFRYGAEWFLPWSGWMSINLRPPFPLGWATFPQVLGPIGYAAVVAGGFFLVLRYRDLRALIGLSLLMPAVLFATEFTTVWVQDPFVLYRSYLWAIGVPGIVFLVVHGPSGRVLLAVGLVLGALFVWQGIDRVLSMRDAETVWTDAIRKLPADPRSVGSWFPYLNRGAAYVDTDSFGLALRDFEASASLGDLGMGSFNMGSVLSARGKQKEALAAFDRAEKQGYNLYNLPFQRGLALLALRRPEEALKQFEITRAMNPPSPTRELMLLEIGRASIQLGRRDEAAQALEQLVALEPGKGEARFLLSMAYIMKNEPQRALPLLDKLVAEEPSARAYYARALANYGLRRKAEASADIDEAIRRGMDNANLREWQAKIRALP